MKRFDLLDAVRLDLRGYPLHEIAPWEAEELRRIRGLVLYCGRENVRVLWSNGLDETLKEWRLQRAKL